MSEASRIPPVEKSIVVPWGIEKAFERFTDGIAEWWPLATHSVGQGRARTCAFEPEVGGRLYETLEDGTEHVWGTVRAWDPPTRVAFTWHPGLDEAGHQDVEVAFRAEGDGTRVALVHSGWERLGEEGAARREAYGPGWDRVLGLYADAGAGESAASSGR